MTIEAISNIASVPTPPSSCSCLKDEELAAVEANTFQT